MDHFIKQANKFYPTIKFTAEISKNEKGHERGSGNPNSQTKFGQNPSPSGKFSCLVEIAVLATKILTGVMIGKI